MGGSWCGFRTCWRVRLTLSFGPSHIFFWPRCTGNQSIAGRRRVIERYVASHEIVRKTHLVRQIRGRKRLRPARGHYYDFDAIFERLNSGSFMG